MFPFSFLKAALSTSLAIHRVHMTRYEEAFFPWIIKRKDSRFALERLIIIDKLK